MEGYGRSMIIVGLVFSLGTLWLLGFYYVIVGFHAVRPDFLPKLMGWIAGRRVSMQVVVFAVWMGLGAIVFGSIVLVKARASSPLVSPGASVAVEPSGGKE